MTSDRFDQEQMFQWIKDQVSMGARRAGSAADRRNEDYIEAHLRDFGLRGSSGAHPHHPLGCPDTSVEIDDGSGFKRVDAFPIPYSAFTAPEGKEARLVFADRDTLWHRADWEGAIVVTEIGFPELDVKLLRKFSLGQYDPDGSLDLVKHPATWVRLGWHLYHLAAKRGAVGFIGIVKDQPGGSCHMYAPYGFREKDISTSRSLGSGSAGLRRRGCARRPRAAPPRPACASRIREPATMHNIVGEVPAQATRPSSDLPPRLALRLARRGRQRCGCGARPRPALRPAQGAEAPTGRRAHRGALHGSWAPDLHREAPG